MQYHEADRHDWLFEESSLSFFTVFSLKISHTNPNVDVLFA
jgi:hypothetical protein